MMGGATPGAVRRGFLEVYMQVFLKNGKRWLKSDVSVRLVKEIHHGAA
jgi:hypothetical protein